MTTLTLLLLLSLASSFIVAGNPLSSAVSSVLAPANELTAPLHSRAPPSSGKSTSPKEKRLKDVSKRPKAMLKACILHHFISESKTPNPKDFPNWKPGKMIIKIDSMNRDASDDQQLG